MLVDDVAVRVTVPENPFRDVMVIVEVAAVFVSTLAAVGLASMPKFFEENA